MNRSIQKITTGLSLALSLSLVSCEKEGLREPTPSGNARLGVTNDVSLPSPTIPQVHRLTKYGDAILTYASNGQLQNVTTTNQNGLVTQTDYSYGPGSIRAFTHQGRTILRDETFTLDATGRCTESVIKGKPNDVHWLYNYDAKGRIWSLQNTSTCVGGTSFIYNEAGDLVTAAVATSVFDSNTATFIYTTPGSSAFQEDLYPLNVISVRDHDRFLRIFGKPGRHLIRKISFTSSNGSPVLNDQYFSYGTDYDGYVQLRDQLNSHGLIGDDGRTLYEYELSNIPFQF